MSDRKCLANLGTDGGTLTVGDAAAIMSEAMCDEKLIGATLFGPMSGWVAGPGVEASYKRVSSSIANSVDHEVQCALRGLSSQQKTSEGGPAAPLSDLDPEERLACFVPGKLGFQINPLTGDVGYVSPDGQAALQDVKVGWHVKLIDDLAFDISLLAQRSNGESAFVLTFNACNDDIPQTTSEGMNKIDTIKFGSGLSTNCASNYASLESIGSTEPQNGNAIQALQELLQSD